MTRACLAWQKYRYFPYERELAKQEIEAIGGALVSEEPDRIEVRLDRRSVRRLSRLTYFREAVLSDGRVIVPEQAHLEASASGTRSSDGNQVGGEPTRPGRQITRYSAHGLHEYRGKFNPQVVRALGNILGLEPGDWVLDPFCGSGTTLLEAAHIGWNSVGIDLNPLGVAISKAKIRAIHASPAGTRRAVSDLVGRLNRRADGLDFAADWTEEDMQRLAGPNWWLRLPSLSYLEAWFPRPVLAQLATILEGIDGSPDRRFAQFFKVVLSDTLREVSWQDTSDLRIRRRKLPAKNHPAIPLFIQALGERTDAILRAREVLATVSGRQFAFLADSRDSLNWIRRRVSGFHAFDAVVTSPPYATALPYIDTQRLSLCALGMIAPEAIMRLDRFLIGTREIVGTERGELEALLRSSRDDLPDSVRGLCRTLLELSRHPSNGFRRRNMPALTYKYFVDMSRVFETIRQVLRPGRPFAMIVGRNRTTSGGKSIIIDTPTLLGDVACAKGWRLRALTELDAYHRFEMRRRNSIKTECLVVLENPTHT